MLEASIVLGEENECCNAAGVDRLDPPPKQRPRAGGCEPFNCETPGAASSYATLHDIVVYNPIVRLLLCIWVA